MKFTEKWLISEQNKDKIEIENHKKKLIDEIKKLNKEEMFKINEIEKKESFFNKLMKIFN